MAITNVNSLFRQVDLSLLKHFLDVANYGGFTKASRATGISQPALSLGVQRLERTLRVKLIVRGGREFRLTDAGGELFQFCRRFESGLQSVVEGFGSTPVNRRTLRIGTALSVGFGPLVSMCKRASRLSPPLDIEMVTQNTYELMKAVSSSEIDAALLPNDVSEKSLAFYPIYQDQVIFVIGRKHAPLLRSADWISKLRTVNLITYPRDTPMRATVDRLLREKHLSFRETFSVNSIEAMKMMVSRNLGGAFVLKSLVFEELKAGLILEPKRNILRIRSGVVLATRQDERGSEVVKQIMKLLERSKK